MADPLSDWNENMLTERAFHSDPTAFSALPRGLAALRVLLEAGLAGLLGLIGAQVIWFMLYGADTVTAPIDIDHQGARTGSAPSLAASALGRFRPVQGEEVAVVQATPESTLGYTLHGVRGGKDVQSGSAIIDIPRQGQVRLTVGEQLAPGIVLEQVFPDRIILNRRGARESLFIDEAARRHARQAGAAMPVPASPDNGDTRQHVSFSERRYADAWMRDLTVTPVLANGVMRGVQVEPEGEGHRLDEIGLEAGDIIVMLNGVPLTSQIAAQRAFAQLEAADLAVVRVERNGSVITVETSLR